jgi:hypothetical protein
VEKTDEASDDGGVRQERRELRADRQAGRTDEVKLIGASLVRTFATAGTTGAICGRISASSPATCDSRGSLPPGSRE